MVSQLLTLKYWIKDEWEETTPWCEERLILVRVENFRTDTDNRSTRYKSYRRLYKQCRTNKHWLGLDIYFHGGFILKVRSVSSRKVNRQQLVENPNNGRAAKQVGKEWSTLLIGFGLNSQPSPGAHNPSSQHLPGKLLKGHALLSRIEKRDFLVGPANCWGTSPSACLNPRVSIGSQSYIPKLVHKDNIS